MAAVDSVSGSSNTSQMATSRSTIADNFDTFLSILTTQLRNQNPLDPMDTNQFTQQLVQFTGVEQQLKTNEFLETLMLSSQNTAKSDAVSYIGKEVTSSGKTGELTGENAVFWAYSAAANAAKISAQHPACIPGKVSERILALGGLTELVLILLLTAEKLIEQTLRVEHSEFPVA